MFDADFDIAGLALRAAQHLMDHDVGIRQRVTLPFAPAASSTAPMLAACPTQ